MDIDCNLIVDCMVSLTTSQLTW